MPLDKMKLAKDIKKALDKMEQKGKKKGFKTPDDPHEFLGKEISKAIDNYIRKADVEGEHNMSNYKMVPGCQTLEYAPPYATPTPGATISPGNPAPQSTKGPFGKGAYPGAKGKIT